MHSYLPESKIPGALRQVSTLPHRESNGFVFPPFFTICSLFLWSRVHSFGCYNDITGTPILQLWFLTVFSIYFVPFAKPRSEHRGPARVPTSCPVSLSLRRGGCPHPPERGADSSTPLRSAQNDRKKETSVILSEAPQARSRRIRSSLILLLLFVDK